MLSDLQLYANALWIAVGLIWLLAALNVKRTVAVQPTSSRAPQVVFVVAGFLLIFSRAFSFSFLARPLLPAVAEFPYLGFLLTITGIGFSFWARFFIGRNWSSDVTIKQDHQLIRSGPYRIVRHPIYFGFLLALLGTALLANELRAYLGVLLCAAGFHLKAAVEEKFMTQQFGSEYQQYRQQTKALIPFVL